MTSCRSAFFQDAHRRNKKLRRLARLTSALFDDVSVSTPSFLFSTYHYPWDRRIPYCLAGPLAINIGIHQVVKILFEGFRFIFTFARYLHCTEKLHIITPVSQKVFAGVCTHQSRPYMRQDLQDSTFVREVFWRTHRMSMKPLRWMR